MEDWMYSNVCMSKLAQCTTVNVDRYNYSADHRQRQNETHSNVNAFAAQLKHVCVHCAQVMNSRVLKAGFILEAKLLLTNQPTSPR